MNLIPGNNNGALSLYRNKSTIIVFALDEYVLPEKVFLCVVYSETASQKFEFVKLSDGRWACVITPDSQIVDGIYNGLVFFNDDDSAYAQMSVLVNDFYEPRGPAILRGLPGSQIRRGSAPPDEYTPGVPGDYWIDDTEPALYGPKNSDGSWGEKIPL